MSGNLTYFDLPADNVERARKFYSNVFGWSFEEWPQSTPGNPYLNITTGDGGIPGGLYKRNCPEEGITVHFLVESVNKISEKIEESGGKVLIPRMAIESVGYYALCRDSEGNIFGIWERLKSD